KASRAQSMSRSIRGGERVFSFRDCPASLSAVVPANAGTSIPVHLLRSLDPSARSAFTGSPRSRGRHRLSSCQAAPWPAESPRSIKKVPTGDRGMAAQDSALGKAKFSAPETELIDIGEQARLSARRRERIMSFASPLGLLLIWEIAGWLGLIDVRFFPVPSSIIGVMAGMLMSGELIEHVLISLQRILLGFLLGGIPAIVIGIIMGLS